MKIWERYFYKQLLRNAGLFLLVFYGLYILIDFSSHLSGANNHHSKLKSGEFVLHYLSEFSLRADILLPFALLIGTIHTLCQLNIHSELIALLAGGHSLNRLLRPFLITGLIGVAFLYINNEWLLPKALKASSGLDSKYAKSRSKSQDLTLAQSIRLKGDALLIYKDFDPVTKQFFEVFFLPTLDEVWRMEILEPFSQPPKGYSVDHFQTENGTLAYQNKYASKVFPSLQFDEKNLTETLQMPKELSLSTLLRNTPDNSQALENEKAARTLTALYQKLALPWLCLLAIIGPAPFCLRFSRQLPVFFIFALGIFGLVALYLIMDAFILLGERQVLAPSSAIFIPMGLFLSFFLYRYSRLRT